MRRPRKGPGSPKALRRWLAGGLLPLVVVALWLILRPGLAGAAQPAGGAGAPPVTGSHPKLVLQVGHLAGLTCVAFSPDERMLGTGSADLTVRLWDLATGQINAVLDHPAAPRSVEFSPDGSSVVTVDDDHAARVWSADSGDLVATLRGHTDAIVALSFSPDSRTIATGSEDRTVRLWDPHSGRLRSTLSEPSRVVALGFSPDGRTLATASHPRTVRLRDAGTGQVRAEVAGIRAWVRALDFTPDGRQLAIRCNGDIYIAGLEDGRAESLRKEIPGGPEVLARSADGRIIATLGRDGGVSLRPTGSTARPVALRGLKWEDEGHSLCFLPDGRTVMTVRSNAAEEQGVTDAPTSAWVSLWDRATGRRRTLFRCTEMSESESRPDVVASPGGHLLAYQGHREADEVFVVRIRSIPTGTLRQTLDARSFSLTEARLTPDGKRIWTRGWGTWPMLWEVSSGRVRIVTFGDHGFLDESIAFSPSGTLVAIGGTDGRVRLGNTRTGQLRATASGHGLAVGSAAFSPDGKRLATAAVSLLYYEGVDPARAGVRRFEEDRTVRLWDPATGKQTAVLHGNEETSEIAFSPDGRTIAVAGVGVKLWDTASGRRLASLDVHAAGAFFSPDGRDLYVAVAYEPKLQVRDARSGRLKLTLNSVVGSTKSFDPAFLSVAARAFSPDGQILATSDGSEEARLWSTATGQRWGSLRVPGRVKLLAFSRDGDRLAAVDASKRVHLWNPISLREQPVTPRGLSGFSPAVSQPLSADWRGVQIHTPLDGRVLATLVPFPESESRPLPGPRGAKVPPPAAGWFVTTPEGYFDCSPNTASLIKWNVGGKLYPAERYMRRFRRPDLVGRALAGERIQAPAMTGEDVPPSATFAGLKSGDAATSDPLTVTVEARDDRQVKEVELFVNGRPLSPQSARPVRTEARELPADPRDLVQVYRRSRSFTFLVPLPVGASEVRLRAIAYDETDLASDPVEVVLKRAGVKSVAGDLYVLSVGVGRYRHAAGGRVNNLRFPVKDATAIAERFQREGRPLYERVHVRSLLDEQATAANVRDGLKWLQESVRPGQVDTVVVFLSGHGVSDEGRYYFATHEVDPGSIAATAVSGRELREALGGKLRAKAVFLFVDTCHAGGLPGRNEDLTAEIGEGVYLLASSGAREVSYEDTRWGHGAFTLALRRSLDRKELADEGAIRFNALTFAVPNEVAALMRAAGRSETEQQPCVPWAGRQLRVPIVQAQR